ncbi:MAG TPA: Gfo/Idh/MocA family oxidoreductase [Planctomycetota bacterium]|nr:Gfo/Idh/MocA family oxidoreductase [Planctomycetota bacterium]
MKQLRIGIYGANGHQVHGDLVNHPRAKLTAIASFPKDKLPEPLREEFTLATHSNLQELLRDENVDLVALCSPRRADQANDAIACLKAGKHVYAEKPAALSEADLDRVLEAADKSKRRFHEMAGTAFAQPYLSMRKIVQSGVLGPIVQVIAQKSYPYHDGRPQDELVDGGLLCQAGIHGVRFFEHVACLRIKDVQAMETGLGNPKSGNLKMAAAYMFRLENGAVGTLISNYLNQKGHPKWGNEHLRIFGTNGFVESSDGGMGTRLIIKEKDLGPIDTSEPSQDYFDLVVNSILDGTPMPLSLEEELHPLRICIRAKAKAEKQ